MMETLEVVKAVMASAELKMASRELVETILIPMYVVKNEVIAELFTMINVMTGNLDTDDGCDDGCHTEMGWE